MKHFLKGFLLMAVSALIAISCNDDGDRATITFDTNSAYFAWGESQEVAFYATHIKSYSVTTKPDGWADPVIDAENRILKITAPAQEGDKVETSGTIVLMGTSTEGKSVTASLFVSISETVDFTAEPANSYLANKKQTHYLFDAMVKGEGQGSLQTASVKIIWQSHSSVIQHLRLHEGVASFYVGKSSEGEIPKGNALLGAYDSKGKLLWSWHIWVADYDPQQAGATLSLNGYEMMGRNLGALEHSNATSADIFDSYGLYYQWGRKEPFIGPSTYQFSNGTSAAMYDDKGARLMLLSETITPTLGTMEYATEHPLSFLVGVEESGYDWLWSGSNALWGEEKGLNDPCPRGWKVAPAAAFAGLSIKEPLTGVESLIYYDKYGWPLTDGNAESLFMAGGRRIYPHTDEEQSNGGKFQNIYINPDEERTPLMRNEALYNQPWVGLYWTSDSQQRDASAFYFIYNKAKLENSRVEGIVPHYRANGMLVRCVADR